MEIVRRETADPGRRTSSASASCARATCCAATSRATSSSSTSQRARHHDDARQGRRLGARQRAVPGDVRPRLLRDRDDVDRRRARRRRALRLRGLPRLAAPGRPAHPLRPRLDQDGAGRPAHLRPDARAEVGDRDGRLLVARWASSTTTRSCPADKFMPVDVHVPGCPPRPEALMHGILKLRSMIQDDPSLGWRERYGAVGTEEVVPERADRRRRPPSTSAAPGDTAVPDATGLELLAQDLRESARRTARPSTPCTSAARRALARRARRASARRSQFLREQGFALPGQRPRRRLLPRRAAPRRPLRAARHGARSTASRSSCASPLDAPRVPVGHARLADGQPPGARGLRHVRRGLRRPPRPAPDPHARGLRGPPAAPRLPDRRRAGPLHQQRGHRDATTRQ